MAGDRPHREPSSPTAAAFERMEHRILSLSGTNSRGTLAERISARYDDARPQMEALETGMARLLGLG